ncbi:MAG: O-antigen ligase family protein [Planctomycetota bacterium]
MRQDPHFTPSAALQACWRVADVGIVIAVAFSALCLGGRHDVGRLIYIAGVAVAAVGWVGARWCDGRVASAKKATLIAAAAVIVAIVQLIELPVSWRGLITPGVAQHLPTWFGNGKGLCLGDWGTASLTPAETWLGLAMLVTHVAFFFIVLERLVDRRQVRRLANFLIALSVGMASIGVVQWMLPNGKVLWLYDHPFREFGLSVQGTFANSNHFGHFIVLGVPALIMATLQAFGIVADGQRRLAFAQGAIRGRQALSAAACSAALAVSLAAILMADSRGALIALLIALAVTAALVFRHEVLRYRPGAWSFVGSTIVIGLLLIGGQLLIGRTVRLAAAIQDGVFAEEAGRQAIWAANIEAFLSSPWIGWGAGSHRFVYKLFLESPSSTEFTHAESGFLQIATETGIAGCTVLVAAVLLVAAWCLRLCRRLQPGSRVLACAFVPPLTASLIHATVDFVWYLPACAAPALAAAAAVSRLACLESSSSSGRAQVGVSKRSAVAFPLIVAFAVVCAGLAYAGPAVASVSWDRYQRVSRAMRAYNARYAQDGASQSHVEQTRAYLDEMLTLLNKVVRAHPGHVEAHLRISARALQKFELGTQQEAPFSAIEIRDAAIASKFHSRCATTAWLRTALGDRSKLLDLAHRHADQVVSRCPLAGEVYLVLAELSFLSPPWLRLHGPLVEQAVLLRPRDGRVLFNAGKLLRAEAQYGRAAELWSQSSRCPGSHRRMLAALMCHSGVPASAMLEMLKPVRRMFLAATHVYAAHGRSEDHRALAKYGERLARLVDPKRSSASTSRLWIAVSNLWEVAGDLDAAITTTTEANQSTPENFAVRYRLASLLLKAGDVEGADPHIRWCLARRLDLPTLRTALSVARREACVPYSPHRVKRQESLADSRVETSPATLSGRADDQ